MFILLLYLTVNLKTLFNPMSFDLYFYKRKDNPLKEEDVALYLTKNLPFNTSKSNRQWDYENPETEVYFVIEWDKSKDSDFFEEFEEFTCMNFTFSLNFFRPRFFGLESFPIIEKFINDLDLFIFDPQDFGEKVIPQKFPKDFLKEEWIQHNDLVTYDHYEEYKLKYMPVEKSDYLWSFQLHREELQNSLSEDLFVAGILVLERIEDGALCTVCVWPQHIPVILPKVDYVIIKKVYKKFFRNVEESGLVSYDAIMSKLGKSFENFDYEIPNLKVLRKESARKIEKQFNDLKIECSTVDFGKMIGMDKFVNARPQ
jgi:hypothetical protein